MYSNTIEKFKEQRATRYKKATPQMPEKYTKELQGKDFSWWDLVYVALSFGAFISTTVWTIFLWILFV